MSKIGDVVFFIDFSGEECEGQIVSIQNLDATLYYLITTDIENEVSELDDDLAVNHVCCGNCQNCTCQHDEDEDDDCCCDSNDDEEEDGENDDLDDDCYTLATCIFDGEKFISIDNDEELAQKVFDLYCEEMEQDHIDRLAQQEFDDI